MHTTQLPSGNLAHHNGDFSGEIHFVIDTGGWADEDIAELKVETDKIRVFIPFEDLKHLVASWKRSELISKLEQESADEILTEW